MVAIHDTELKEGIQKAIVKAKDLKRPILVSEVQAIEQVEPLSFFATGSQDYFGERFFWKDSSDEIFIVGIGISKDIQSDQATDRFFHVKKEWNGFLDDSIIINPFDIEGTGPAMFGGFTFDPLKGKTKLWEKFSDSTFHIPKFMYSMIKGQAYLTTNIVCTQHDDVSLLHKVWTERNHMMSNLAEAPYNSENLLLSQTEIHPEQWMNTVDQVVGELKSEEMKKVVLARETRLRYEDPIKIEAVLANLLEYQKNSFIYAYESNGDCFIGASPERLVKKQGKNLFTTCLAGSIKRGQNQADDDVLGQELLTDEKNLEEHQYVVDMIKAAMEQVSVKVKLPDQPRLMKLRDIQHLYTPVTAEANADSSILQLIERLHPTPALGGVPRTKAVEKIRELESLDRGMYGSPLGWLDYKGNGDFAVALRSGLIQQNEASIFAGCGVVKDSTAESEYQETKIKFRPMLSALGGIE
ncbi:isochorismate synthase [Cytobacillus purgationiresistens]|uniref:Isochorismate synthase MenF n=1 Tax=Cytobacillus purgationiresistens TaxID=863449 RepID=A0ABU0ARD8_9BACI|nr:isochorismate synthase [Cytobacillus purgationiresistens]MDQ0273836.1 menaquinone-specific isochorismate synthase [Cytobacillus purgationiresistens]